LTIFRQLLVCLRLKIRNIIRAHPDRRLALGLEQRHASVSFILRASLCIGFVDLINGGLAIGHASRKEFGRRDQAK
jgi:hypothetical protein